MAAHNRMRGGLSAMKTSEKVLARRAAAAACAAVLAAVLLAPADSFAWTSTGRHYNSSRGRGYGYSSHRYGVDQGISAAEESRREAGRAKRREEIGEAKEAHTKDFLAGREAQRAASRAASRAPRDAYYRKPGTTEASLPPSSAKFEVGGKEYHYSRGMFYRELAGKYLVVPAPVGAVVDALPEGYGVASYKGDFDTYAYYFGTFYVEENGKFKVVSPPAGTVVGYIPDGYTEAKVDETLEYQFGSITYRPAFYGDETVYEVVKG